MLKLFYADFAFWRAECIRMSLFFGDVPFEDIRNIKLPQLREEGKLTFGSLPVLEVDDGKILSQTQAMANYASRLAGIHPTDPWEMAKIDECLSGCTDVTGTIGKTFSLKGDEQIEARRALMDSSNPEQPGKLWQHLQGLNQICAANQEACDTAYSVGSSITVADFAIWRLVAWVDSGILNGVPPKYASDTFPALGKLVEAVDQHEKVQEWIAKHPTNYKK